MFRISRYMNLLVNGPVARPKGAGRAAPAGPVVIWNLIRRCNLNCRHCYSLSADTNFPGELSFKEVCAVMDDLKSFGVPALILSGGEPLLRKDIFDIARRAVDMGFFVGLSSNGTLIDETMTGRIRDAGFDYVGISIDGTRETHDAFRRHKGGYDAALRGARLSRDAGLKVGLRFTLTKDNASELPALLDLMEAERLNKFYLSHLNYAGRGNTNREDDAHHNMTRQAMDLLFETSLHFVRMGEDREFVTGNNDADGVYLLHWAAERFADEDVARLREGLVRWGGNSSGVGIANIDNLGHVHPDTFWSHHDLGSIRHRPFSQIWQDTSDPIMAGLKQNPRTLSGRCGLCRHFDICGGNTRVRAWQVSDDPWAEDPGCYLDEGEIGVVPHGLMGGMSGKVATG